MSTTLTIRTNESLKAALRRRAREQGKRPSELAREILADALTERPWSERVGTLRGRLDPARGSDPWREAIRRANWRP
ncbi:MAG: hypothetical protein ACREI7_00475 [Myxococcota bacterium]